jgi:hypothetical protein
MPASSGMDTGVSHSHLCSRCHRGWTDSFAHCAAVRYTLCPSCAAKEKTA